MKMYLVYFCEFKEILSNIVSWMFGKMYIFWMNSLGKKLN